MAGRRITIEFLGSDKSASKTALAVEKRFGKTGKTLDRVGQVAGKALAFGAIAGGAALVKMGQAAADDQAAQVKLAKSLQNAAGATKGQVAATESWITAQGRALGVADDDLRPALSRLAVATGDVDKAQRLASLGMDISAGTGKSLEAVTTALAKAQNGSLVGLARLGIATKNADGSTKSLQQITKELADTYSGQAATAAETTAGKQQKLRVQLSELGESIGAVVLPAMVRLSEIGLQMVMWVDRNRVLVGTLTAVVATFAAGLWIASVAMRAAATLSAVWTGAQWLLNAALTANPIGLVVVGIAALVAALVIAYKKSETFRKIVDGAFRGVQQAASKAFNWVRSNWPLILAVLAGPIGLAVLAINKHWDTIRSGITRVAGWFKALPGRIVGALSGIADTVKSIGHNIIAGMIAGVREKVSSLVQAARDAVTAAINAAKDKLGISSPSKVFRTIGNQTADGFIKGLEEKRDRIKEKVSSLVQASKDAAASFRGSFSQSLFSADFGGPDGNGSPSVSGILEFQRAQAAKAKTLQANVKALLGKGLSKDLIQQMLSAGASGEAQISALAGASVSDIAQLNSLNSATNSSLASAGSSVGSALYGGAIRAAKDELIEVKLMLDSKEIHRALIKRKRLTGANLGLA